MRWTDHRRDGTFFATMDQQTYKIEKNIPVPPDTPRSLSEAVRMLEVGDSFSFHGFADTVYRLARRHGVQIRAQRVDGGKLLSREKSDIRVWRVA
jgi:hypothetical protein